MRFGGNPTADDLLALVQNAVHEDRELDFKEALPGNSPDSHRDFLYDASSLANAAGGLLIFGVRERRDGAGKPTGEPEAAPGLADFNQDAAIQRLESMLRDGIEPRLPGIRPHVVPGLSDGPALIFAIPKSWAGPHMVKYGGMARFYTRNNRGNEPMNYHQIRDAFAASSDVIEKARNFRRARIRQIEAGVRLPTSLQGSARSVLHLIPLSTIGQVDAVDLVRPRREIGLMLPPGWRAAGSMGERMNFDGYARTDETVSYVQLFRSGALEAVDSHLLDYAPNRIPWPTLGKELMEQTRHYLKCLDVLGCDPPVAVAVTLVNVQTFSIGPDGGPSFFPTRELDLHILSIPEVIAESLNIDVTRLMRPIFDILWQSCGRDRCDNYDSAGNCNIVLED
jgi:hypothetical protein